MSHEIDTTTGQPAIAYAESGGKPWHGLGNSISADSLVGMSTEEILSMWQVAAGMNWRILQSRIRFATSQDNARDGLYATYDADQRGLGQPVVLFRSDTESALSIVSARYKIVQPAQVINFFHEIIDSLGYTMETAGCLFDGRQFWALARAPGAGQFVKDKRDAMNQYLLIMTSCDGTQPTRIFHTAVRAVCSNTITLALDGQNASGIKWSHRTTFDADAAKRELKLTEATQSFDRAMDDFRAMAESPLLASQSVDLTGLLTVDGWDKLTIADKPDAVKRSRIAGDIGETLFGTMLGSDMEGAGQGTVWGWLNAVTQTVDHPANNRSHSSEASLNSAWFGKGAELKSRALMIARRASAGKIVLEEIAEAVTAPKPLLERVLENTVLI